MTTTWCHLHLPRLRAGETPNVISMKVPGQRIDYVSAVELTGELKPVEFKVHEAGRQRCIRENVRNVHAWVVGDMARYDRDEARKYMVDTRYWSKAIYDPWKGDSFVNAETLEPVKLAHAALLVGKDVWYRDFTSRWGRCDCGRIWKGNMPDNHSLAVCAP